MQKVDKEYNIFDVVIVIFLIYLSGNPFFRMLFFKQSVIVLSILSIVYFMYNKVKNGYGLVFKKREIQLLLVTIILIISILITFLINEDNNLSTYIAIILQVVSVCLCVLSLNFDNFIKIFTKIMVFLAVFSLIFYSVQYINPYFPYIFPQYQGNYQIYSNAFVYNYMLFNDYGNYFLMNRNTGIFWEPGCYQVFLNVALFFYISIIEKQSVYLSPKNIIVVFIFIITVISTKSTTGYFCLAIILLPNIKFILYSINKNINNRRKTLRIFFVIVFISIISFMAIYKFDVGNIFTNTISKISNDSYMNGNGLIERLSLNKFKYLFTENKIHIFGISYDTLYNNYTESNIWNSILEDTICLGYIFSGILFFGYIKFSKYLNKNVILLLLVLIIGFSTESLFRSPVFLFMTFSGIAGNNAYKKSFIK